MTGLRLQSFDIRLNDEPRVGTPLRRYLVKVNKIGIFKDIKSVLLSDLVPLVCLLLQVRSKASFDPHSFIGGFVAIVVGGELNGTAVEIFSPDGKCQHRLADIPKNGSYYHIPVLALVDNRILSCGGRADSKVHRVTDYVCYPPATFSCTVPI